ncbi:hypothetical protein Y09_1370 [Brachybacterium sp. SW0106-09]|uniref:hypothetical protein n=1 Tax=Brachybacterium sp. SW0106-09 TaxID=1704590 RepID=UPI0006B53CC0|nr:hypothetical protein [Brachybacterium sp. SW0106-09]GAP78541.1 hypothetical protein Y09_1370 [Brachybacterium sp. SW0106-09]
MLLRDRNLRYAALKLIADIVADAMKAEKADHLDALETSAEDSGAKSWTVTLGGEKVASVTLAQRAGGPKIADEQALAEHLEAAHPEMVETVKRLKPWASKDVLASIVEVTDDGAVTKDGEILPGIVEAPAGAPYQSLRWDAKSDGKDVVADAIRSGDLRDLLGDTGLPMLDVQA